MSQLIESVSDTALWIAGFRAEETKRKDAVFKDVHAEKLAGEKGLSIVNATPHKESMAFAMVVRTCAIDHLIEIALTKGIDTVINLGSGMDTRPYRMKIPHFIKWIEVDLPSVIQYKKELLSNEIPSCSLNYIACDLSNDEQRIELFNLLGKQAKKALIVTEGLIGYLSNEEARKFSQSLYAISSFQYWIMDYSQGKFRKRKSTKDLQKLLKHVRLRFNEDDPIGFFQKDKWRVSENLYILDEADRIGRKLPLEFPMNIVMWLFHKKLWDLGNKTYGYVLFDR